MDHTKHINYCLKITLLHFDLKFEDCLTNSKTSFVSQDVRPNGSFAVPELRSFPVWIWNTVVLINKDCKNTNQF